MGLFGKSPSRDIKRGRRRALAELERSFEGPLRGLQIAGDFFKLLGSPELANTPLGKSLGVQNRLIDTAFSGLDFGQGGLPSDIGSAIGENLASAQGARGVAGSPASALQASNRFLGASENVRQNRIGQALSILQGVAGGALFPSASQFAQIGAQRSGQAANIEMQAGLALANARAAENAERGQLIGTAATVLGGGFLGAAGAIPGILGASGAGGGFGGFLKSFGSGAGVGAGILDAGQLQQNQLFSQLFGNQGFSGSGGPSQFNIMSLLQQLQEGVRIGTSG